MGEWGGFWIPVALLGIVVYMICQAVRDYRRGDYAWAAFGATCMMFLVALLLLPIQTHAVKLDMPIQESE